MIFKKLFSFFLPLRLKNYPSDLNGKLEINLVDGKKVLDTKSSNYSFGSLQMILERGLSAISFNKHFENILVLGMGAGSIVESVRDRFRSDALITLVDIDPIMATIAREEFDIQRYHGVKVVIQDAEEFLLHDPGLFRLIIVDLFIIDTIPEKFTKQKFIDLITARLGDKGVIIYNTISKTLPAPALQEIRESFERNGFELKVLHGIANSNDLILASKNP